MKFVLLVLVFASLLLLGCTSETPKGDVNPPNGIQSSNTQAASVAPSASPVNESFRIGEKAVTSNGFEVTLLSVTKQACGFSGETNCTVANIRAKNIGNDPNYLSLVSPAILDDLQNQYDQEYVGCPDPSEPTDTIYPQITKEFNICFKEISASAKKIKIVLPVGLIERTNLVYEASASEVK